MAASSFIFPEGYFDHRVDLPCVDACFDLKYQYPRPIQSPPASSRVQRFGQDTLKDPIKAIESYLCFQDDVGFPCRGYARRAPEVGPFQKYYRVITFGMTDEHECIAPIPFVPCLEYYPDIPDVSSELVPASPHKDKSGRIIPDTFILEISFGPGYPVWRGDVFKYLEADFPKSQVTKKELAFLIAKAYDNYASTHWTPSKGVDLVYNDITFSLSCLAYVAEDRNGVWHLKEGEGLVIRDPF
ncbi:hypothetical protein BDN70DRAFT_956794 [Pholiota conissans]|uniref:Uncharacterized protein n=1 Tax=Pholiota conissans TaxID=109636 RepID=A0A9P6CQR8_9AGAR|nr:hypothetical protein BDN70DRAFT_956794 [Pholiota conissans]